MRVLSRTLAAATVATSVVLAPILSRLAIVPELDLPPAPVERFEKGRPLPSTWPARVASALRRDGARIECAELDSVVLHVERAASRFGLDPLTVLAVIKVESGFDPFAVSPAGAMGLMQLRPETAAEVASRLGIEWTSDELSFDPQVNVLLGTAYLRELLDRFGNLDVALAAFHSGPNRIASQNQVLGATSLQYTERVWDAIVVLHKSARV